MKVKISERQRSIGVMVIWVFSICLLIGIAVWRFSSVLSILNKVLDVMEPIIWGVCLAYLLTPLMKWTEKKTERFLEKKKKHPRIKRAIGVTFSVLALLAVITGIVAMVLPELYNSLKNLMTSLPSYIESVSAWITNRLARLKDDQPQIYGFLNDTWSSTKEKLSNFATEFEPKLDMLSGGADILSTITSGAVTVVNTLKNFVLGVMVAIYLMFNEETYLAQARKIFYVFLPEKKVHKLFRMGSHVSYNFMHFLLGKTLDSFIIGLICFIGMTILNMPYVALISLLVGVTNIIPFFGPFLGAIPSATLILLSNPSKTIPFVIFIFLLQQFDGNFLGPKILGDSLGLPMVWVMFAIFVGGGIFGFVGMVAFVPIFAAVYTFVSDTISEKLTNKGLPCETEPYMSGEPVFSKQPKPAENPEEAESTEYSEPSEYNEDNEDNADNVNHDDAEKTPADTAEADEKGDAEDENDS